MWENDDSDNRWFDILYLDKSPGTNPIINLFYPQKICIGIDLDYSWDTLMEKLQTMSMQNFGG